MRARATRWVELWRWAIENQLMLTPTMEASVSDHMRSIEEIVGLLDSEAETCAA